MTKFRHIASIFIATMLALGSCCSKSSEQRAVVKEWVGKEIIIPEDLTFQIQDTPINYDFNNADFKIVTYIDSTGCTNCKMKIREWISFIGIINSNCQKKTNFLMVLNNRKKKEVLEIILQNNFKYPIIIDSLDTFNRVNKLSRKETYRTFLIDRHNNVLVIGNPIINPQIKELYIKQIESKY